MNQREVGSQQEALAAEFLKERGIEILETNFRCRLGEIDLIAKDGDYLVFVEVKFRKNAKKGLPFEAVSLSKQKTISKVADYYILTRIGHEVSARFDVVSILDREITWFPNAFSYGGGC